MLISVIYSRGSKSKTVVGSAEKHSVISTGLGGTWGAQRKKGVGEAAGEKMIPWLTSQPDTEEKHELLRQKEEKLLSENL